MPDRGSVPRSAASPLLVDRGTEGADQPITSSARLLPLAPGLYAFSLLDLGAAGRTATGVTLPAVHIGAAPQAPDFHIANLAGRNDQWLSRSRRLFVTSPPGGTVALLTGYTAAAAQTDPIEVEVRRLDCDGATLVLGLARGRPQGRAASASVEAVAILRGEGEFRFIDTRWIGRLGRGRWIEAFTVIPRSALPAAALEYKALTADGEETSWIQSGAACPANRGNVPLVGVSIRQSPGSHQTLFDCEYTGCFQSGAIAGPVRNGAPCLSPAADDPLEGLSIRMVPRPPRGDT